MPPGPATHFLVIQMAHLGDVVLALPVAQRLKATYPNAQVHMLVRQGAENLLEQHPAIDHVWTWDKRQKWRAGLGLLRQLRHYRFEAVVNLHRFASSGLLTLLLRARQRRGFRKNPLSWGYSHRFEHVIDPTAPDAPHEVARNLSVLQGLAPTHAERPVMHLKEGELDLVFSLSGLADHTGPYVVMAPASVWFTKRWPEEHWAALLGMIPPQVKVCIVGGPADQGLGMRLTQKRPGTLNLCGRITLRQTAALMSRAVHVITGDSAPMHLASAVNAPTTALFCSTVPGLGFGPLADHSTVVQAPEPCRPCHITGRAECPLGHFNCGYHLLPEWVAATLPFGDVKKA